MPDKNQKQSQKGKQQKKSGGQDDQIDSMLDAGSGTTNKY
jgi:hypothetical protein